MVDAKGARVPDAREAIKATVTGGPGVLAALGSGDPTDVSSFHTGERVTFQGRVVAIVRPGPAGKLAAGKITLSVSAPNLAPATVEVEVTACN